MLMPVNCYIYSELFSSKINFALFKVNGWKCYFLNVTKFLISWSNKPNTLHTFFNYWIFTSKFHGKQRWILKLQWNLLIPDILYSRHLSTTDTFLGSGWNDGQTLITKPPCSGHLIANTSNIRHVMQEICIYFTLDNVLQFHLSFLWSLLFYFLASLMAFSGPWKWRDCKFIGI